MAPMCMPFWGAADGAVPGRSFPHGLQAPPAGRCHRHPAGRYADRRQPQRRHPAAPAAGRPARPTRRRQARAAAPETRRAAGRSRLRPRQVPPAAAATRITPQFARRGTPHGSGLGRQRWVVERGFAHLHNFRRLRIRYERYPEIHTALLVLACSILCWRRLNSFSTFAVPVWRALGLASKLPGRNAARANRSGSWSCYVPLSGVVPGDRSDRGGGTRSRACCGRDVAARLGVPRGC